ncbi:MAG: hypothetical protein ACYTF1_10030 [Planctomycetota bacterium]|jgi:hypothetical protein
MATIPQTDNIDIRNPQPFREEIDEVVNRPLPPEIKWWIQGYETVGHRDEFLWKWCLRAIEVTSLPSVNPELRNWNNQTKLLGVMLVVVLDDIGDNDQDSVFVEKLLHALITVDNRQNGLDSLDGNKRKSAQFALSLWDEINERVRGYPRYDEFMKLLWYDYIQVFNVIRYSALINCVPKAMNMVEHNLYGPHNMHMVVHGSMDLMCSSLFDSNELGKTRSVLWLGSSMGRVGNLTTTWERELYEGDFSSGVFALALDEGYFDPEELNTIDAEEAKRRICQYRCEEYFLMQWYQYRERICSLASKIKSYDVMGYVHGLDNLLRLHLGSRGLK